MAEYKVPTLEEQWDEFEQNVIPPEASTQTRLEMKQTFFAGIACGINRIIHNCKCEADVDKALKEMEDHIREIREMQNNPIILQSSQKLTIV